MKPMASESILKSVLQAYAYTPLISTIRNLFLTSFHLDSQLRIKPAVLTFGSAQSGRLLKELDKCLHLPKLVETLNDQLAKIEVFPMRFFVVENPDDLLATFPTTTTEANGDVKAAFR